jgi:hypothetical protein
MGEKRSTQDIQHPTNRHSRKRKLRGQRSNLLKKAFKKFNLGGKINNWKAQISRPKGPTDCLVHHCEISAPGTFPE